LAVPIGILAGGVQFVGVATVLDRADGNALPYEFFDQLDN
jgi:Zn-finger domain-containing protein